MPRARLFLQRLRYQLHRLFSLIVALPMLIRHYGSLGNVIVKAFRVLRRQGLTGFRLRVAMFLHLARQSRGDQTDAPPPVPPMALYEIPDAPDFAPRVSVIVPNYNHAGYLRQRLDSIYGQGYANLEVILLDDCSSDDSRAILREYADRYPDITRVAFNTENSGGVFHQWRKGLEMATEMATGELVWIAESDDHCTSNLLAELVPCFANQAVMLAFCRSDFVEDGKDAPVWSTEDYLHDLCPDWRQPFVRSAHWLVNHAWGVKNIVANVSSALFRHPGRLPLLEDPEWTGLKLCGDWIFYLTLIRGGLVAYTPRATNFYRQHPRNTSVGAHGEDRYYQEHERVLRHLVSMYRIDQATLDRNREALRAHWLRNRPDAPETGFDALFDPARVRDAADTRRKNILMASFGFIPGGGETFPITLANLLKRRGHAVTFFNLREGHALPGIRGLLDRDIPVLELDRLELTGAVCVDMGIEIVHSHHAWVDMTLAALLIGLSDIKQVVTMHGMYEMLPAEQIAGMLPLLEQRISRFVYIADKNLAPFSAEFRQRKGFVRIDNALALSEIRPIPRAELGIADDAFVLCVVSRAIPEKGWEEAIQSVAWARAHCQRDIQLLLVGSGDELDRLNRGDAPDFVHFMGFRANTRDYFASADLGFLPSRFGGESYPLVIIDCLHAGRPVLASRLGEIPAMLETGHGPAGALFDLEDWRIPIEHVGRLIADLATDPDRYRALLERVPAAAERFNPENMVTRYETVYAECFRTGDDASQP